MKYDNVLQKGNPFVACGQWEGVRIDIEWYQQGTICPYFVYQRVFMGHEQALQTQIRRHSSKRRLLRVLIVHLHIVLLKFEQNICLP